LVIKTQNQKKTSLHFCGISLKPASKDETDSQVPGLLMRPEHSETKAKTETRECETETEICYETETKNYETETETSPFKMTT